MRHLPSSGLPEQWVPGHPGARPKTAPFAESSLSLLENMSTLTHISDPEDFPYRMNVKLWVQWDGVDTDHDGEDDTFDCSGALLDAKHVITAGHCLWDHEHGGGEADSIVVAPGYDDGDEPYGEASMIRWLTWSGWKDDEDRKHDMAVIELDRPVGALTGDFGYGYRTSCSSFKDYTYYHASYPGESPYDGGDLYFQSGGFDSCPNDYEARFKRYSYGGESGSGFYRIIDDSRYIHAVLSHGDWVLLTGDVTDAVRLTETKFNHIGDFISENTPSSPNLAPLGVQADPLVAKGHTVSPFSFVVYNDGSASSSGLHYQVRLSTNKIISTGDTLLVTVSSTVTIGAKESVTLSPNITIPSTTATGYYYLGVMLTDDDSDESDNTTGSFDVAGVSVF
jgi:V8-like Glu-specific endopeptidase